MCEGGGSRYRRGGDVGVKMRIGWLWCSADVIRSLRCSRFDLCLRPCAEICLQTWRCCIFWICFKELCRQLCHRTETQCVAEERVYICVPIESSLTPSGEILVPSLLSLRSWLCVFKAAANTQLHCLSSLHTGYTHKVQTKAWAYTCKCASLKLPVVILWASTICRHKGNWW